jgi:hypothetical protein
MYMSDKTGVLHSQKRSEPLEDVHMFIAGEHWGAVKQLAQLRDITASELVRRLIAAELLKAAKTAPATKKSIEVPF